ncbi:hypothetical protein [Lentzea sp. CC55]|uniref:hypothetical protein n=1 Tax=Lentzea sp. CC55 TaxID=2884909 RepID=UPI001F39DF2E|nr:hypothetical protein [Lentzea sp. CC55]MCG8927510.1 hypothetical protein [Lentzea sp. CC55]
MIDHLPEHRPLPDDVRLRARQRLSEGMDPPARNGRAVLIAAAVSTLAAGALVASQTLLGGTAEPAAPPMQHNGEFAGKDRAVVNHVERGKVTPDVLARCTGAARAHPPAADWQAIATSRKNGTTLTAFRVPAGVFFCANTATTTTVSAPDPAAVGDGPREVKVLFTTRTGAMAGLVSRDVRIVSLSRISDPASNTALPAVVDGLFLDPSGYTHAETGTKALVSGTEFAVRGVPGPTEAVVDRPLPPAERDTEEEREFARCLRDRPVPDADQFAHALTVRLGATTTMRLGRFGDLLLYCGQEDRTAAATVHEAEDLDEVRGTTVAAFAAFYDFTLREPAEPGEVGAMASSTFAAVGLVTDPRAASITYTRPGLADVPASIGGGTFVLAAPLIDRHPDSRVVVRDAKGAVLETIKPKDVP